MDKDKAKEFQVTYADEEVRGVSIMLSRRLYHLIESVGFEQAMKVWGFFVVGAPIAMALNRQGPGAETLINLASYHVRDVMAAEELFFGSDKAPERRDAEPIDDDLENISAADVHAAVDALFDNIGLRRD